MCAAAPAGTSGQRRHIWLIRRPRAGHGADATRGLGAAFTGLFLLLPASWCLGGLYLSRLGKCWVSCRRMEYFGSAHVISIRYLGRFLLAVRGCHVRGSPFSSAAAWVPNPQHTTHTVARHSTPTPTAALPSRIRWWAIHGAPAAVCGANAPLRVLVPVQVKVLAPYRLTAGACVDAHTRCSDNVGICGLPCGSVEEGACADGCVRRGHCGRGQRTALTIMR